MKLKGIIFEDFINYKKPSMILEFPYCDFKCDKECGEQVCQNSTFAFAPNIDITKENIINSYINNPITEAIIFQGLEPLDSWKDVVSIITSIRKYTNDDIVIYTGYNKQEITDKINQLKSISNIIIKYGRYIPYQKEHYDNVLGINLSSDNQYAEKIS